MKLDRKAAQARCDAATDGPWEWGGTDIVQLTWCVETEMYQDYGKVEILNCGTSYGSYHGDPSVDYTWTREEDAEFAAKARTDLPAALALLDRCEAMLRRVRLNWMPEARKDLEDLLADLEAVSLDPTNPETP